MFWKECKALQDELVAMRRELHQIPELGKDLPQTRAYVTAKLDALGIPYELSETDSGINHYSLASIMEKVAIAAAAARKAHELKHQFFSSSQYLEMTL